MELTKLLREDTHKKKVFFLSGRTTKRWGGGLHPLNDQENKLFYVIKKITRTS